MIDTEPLQPISGLLPPGHLAQVSAIGGDRGVSAGLRDVVELGLAAVNSDAALLVPVDQLQQVADRLAAITGRKLPSGAWWAASDAAMPEPEQLAPTGDVVVSPGRIVLVGVAGALMIDAGGGQLAAQESTAHASQPVLLAELAGVAGMLTAGLVRLAQQGPGRIDLGAGLLLQRLETGAARLSFRDVGATAEMSCLWMFAAELTALCAAGIAESIAVRQQLDAQLEAVR